ncbi:MAG TPA: hypothetical protein VGK49_10060, partial [Ilumatobacteraceae bacterium]
MSNDAGSIAALDEQHRGDVEGGRHAAAALVVLVASWSLAVAAVVLGVINRPVSHPGTWYYVVDVADAIVFGAVGAVLVARTSQVTAWIVSVTAVGGGLAAIASQWFELTLEDPDLPALPILSSMQNWAWIPGTLGLILVVPYLVRERSAGPVTIAAVAAGVVTTAVLFVTRLTDPFPWPEGESMAPLAV